jgi:ComF family protein
VRRARAIGEYDGVLRELIHSLKYEKRHSLARPLAILMRQRGGAILENADCVVPVPLHWRREYQRGFNQARALAQHLELPVIEALVRTRHTRAQVELAAASRHANVADAFALQMRFKSRIRGMRLVLVDDVSTTGATLESCAQVLKDAGAYEIVALTAARVVSRSRHGRTR